MFKINKKSNVSLFSVSIAPGFTSPNLPIAVFHQGDKDLVFLLDTGSTSNLIDRSALENIKYQVCEDKDKISHVSGIGGTQKVTTCSIAFGCEDEKYVANFLITDLTEAFRSIKRDYCITIHGMLGSEFLKENNIVLDFNDLTAYSKL